MVSGAGQEDFTGYYKVGTTPTKLPVGGARPSMHGDILHSRPIALNYGTGNGVVVYYGTNDGLFHAVDGNTTGTTAGQELWSFIAPEFYSSASNNLFERLHDGKPFVRLPENDSTGALRPAISDYSAKPYGIDGAIGTFARYDPTGATLIEAIIYPSMRRGGNSVYALDVTSKTEPKFKWKVSGGTGDYTKLAQTWSIPKPIILGAASGEPPILLVMGGGYDAAEDALIGTSTTINAASQKGRRPGAAHRRPRG